MCFGSHCPYELKSGPDAGECTLRGEELKAKCPTPYMYEIATLTQENDRLYDLVQKIGDLVGMYLPNHVHDEMSRLINDAQFGDSYQTRVQELEAELAALKDEEIPF